jgi:hypothetical protein
MSCIPVLRSDVASVANAEELAHGSSVVDALLQNLENVAVKHVSYSLIEDLLRMVAEHRPNTVDEKGTVEGQEEVVRRTVSFFFLSKFSSVLLTDRLQIRMCVKKFRVWTLHGYWIDYEELYHLHETY